MPSKLERLKEQFPDKVSAIVEAAQEKVSKLFEAVVQAQLDEWGKRFHNHTFTALEGNGSLSFEMHPPFKGCPDNSLAGHFDYIPGYYRRGAIAEMLDQADAIQDLYCGDESIKMAFFSGCKITSKK